MYSLDLDDLDLRTGLLTIRHSKGDRDRQVKLGTLALSAIAAYLGAGRPRQVSTAVRRRPDFAGTALFLSDKAGRAVRTAG